MTTRNYTDEKRWANTDPSLHFNGIESKRHVPSWQGAMIHCLKVGDRESAELIRDRNLPHSDECQYGDHDLCRVLWCKCVCHSRVQFEIEHPQLRSLTEAQSEREEMEYAR